MAEGDMSRLRFEFDWQDPRGARGPEIRATWALLKIYVDDIAVTRIYDPLGRSHREAVFGPLYPLAEWIATHWWFLVSEVECPRTERHATYAERHSMLYAREGYALPDLEICPAGDETLLRWRSTRQYRSRVRFGESGSAVLDAEEVREALAGLVATVKRRLDGQGIEGTLLQEEWEAIDEADDEERDFCKRVGAMGLDPYALDDDRRALVLTIHESLPMSLAEDFFHLSDADRLKPCRDFLLGVLEDIRHLDTPIPELIRLREEAPRIGVTPSRPWQQGCAFARDLRCLLGLNGQPLSDMEGIARSLRIEPGLLRRAMLDAKEPPLPIDGLQGPSPDGSPGFLIAGRSETSRRFTFCRSLFEYLTAPAPDSPTLISPARSDRQKRNRAFAAEFLAPAREIGHRLVGTTVDEEEIAELADGFGVSPWVVTYQIRNNELATVVPAYMD